MNFINAPMAKLFLIFLITGTLVLISGCEFKDIVIEKVGAIQINSTKGSEINGTISLVLNNPNGFAVKVKAAHFDIFMGENKVGEAKLENGFKIEPRSSKSYPVELSGNMSNALAGGVSGILGLLTGRNPKLLFKGEIRAGNFFYAKKIPVELVTEVPIKELLNQ